MQKKRQNICLPAGIFLIIASILSSSGFGQSIQKLSKAALLQTRITLSGSDSIETFSITARKVNPRLDRFYLWYRSNALHSTQGGYAGKLLQGPYQLLSRNQDLLAEGQIYSGLREGPWKYWYADGSLQKTEQWRKGLRHGSYLIYYPGGTLKEQGRYKHGKRHGKRISHWQKHAGSTGADSVVIEKYRNDKLVVRTRKTLLSSKKSFTFLKRKTTKDGSLPNSPALKEKTKERYVLKRKPKKDIPATSTQPVEKPNKSKKRNKKDTTTAPGSDQPKNNSPQQISYLRNCLITNESQ